MNLPKTITPPKLTLIERAYQLRFDPANKPAPDDIVLTLGGDYPICARGNLSVIQGKQKAGKSAVMAAVLGAAQRGEAVNSGDTLEFSWIGHSKGAILHVDTEQSLCDWHSLVTRSAARGGLHAVSDRLVSLPLMMFSRMERVEIVEQAMEREAEAQGGIDLVVIDGIADLCASPNDEAEALELVAKMMMLSQKYNAPILGGIHENPGATQDAPKTRGHLGSELGRKAFANLRVEKDPETGVSTMWGPDMRKKDIPKNHGFCFGWDDGAGMHVYQGRADGVKAAQMESAKVEKETAFFGPVFANSGTNGSCPGIRPEQAREILRDTLGQEKPPSVDALKKRMQRAEILGVLNKASPGAWTMKP